MKQDLIALISANMTANEMDSTNRLYVNIHQFQNTEWFHYYIAIIINLRFTYIYRTYGCIY